jgi:hypothetical protein
VQGNAIGVQNFYVREALREKEEEKRRETVKVAARKGNRVSGNFARS